jgi:RNA-directed DNA polymerase
MQKQICSWLKQGILYGGEYAFPEMGTPQGGIISLLLANIALHGIREDLDRYINTLGGYRPNNRQTIKFFRYKDNFVIMHPNKEVILQFREVIKEFLKPIGLKLNPIKTRMVHTLNATEKRLPGFTFLGFDVIQCEKLLRQRAVFTERDYKQDYIKLITPSKESTQAHRLKIRQIIRQSQGVDQENLIKKLNPIIRRWAFSKRSQIASKIFQNLDAYLWFHLWKWARKRHPKMSKIKLKEKYWHKVGKKNSVFGVKNNKGNLNLKLQLHSKIHIKLSITFPHSTET